MKRNGKIIHTTVIASVVAVIAAWNAVLPAPAQSGSEPNCSLCHSMPPLDGPARDRATGAITGNHKTHQPAGAVARNCSACHFNAEAYTTGHRDGRISFATNLNNSPATGQYKINGNTVLFKNQTTFPVIGSCSNINCHFETETPQWGSAPFHYASESANDCDKCHGVPPAGTGVSKAGGIAGSHTRHNDYFKGVTQCRKCHPDHVSESRPFAHATSAAVRGLSVQLHDPKDVPGGSYSGSANDYLPSQTNSFGVCNNAYCHSTGNGSVTAGNLPTIYEGNSYASPRWGDPGPLACNACHGRSRTDGMPDYASAGSPGSATANSHGKHVASSGFACSECHSRTTKDNATIRSIATHVNGTADIFFNLSGVNRNGSYSSGGKNCSATYCHGTTSAISWGGSTVCLSCHGATFSTFSSAVKKGAHAQHIETETVPTSYTASGVGNVSGDRTRYQFGCASCHSPALAHHANGVANSGGGAAEVFFGFTTAAIKGSYAPGTVQPGTDNGFKWTSGSGCNTTYCHSNGQAGLGAYSVSWNTPNGTLGCTGCHGNATSNTLSGKHQYHLNPAVNTSLGIGNGFGCVDCHAKTVSSSTTLKDKTKHVNKFIDFSSIRDGGSAKYNGTVKQCTNIYCHSNGNPGALVYKNMTGSKTWTGSATLGCNGCHGSEAGADFPTSATGAPNYVSGGAGTATANSHKKHVYQAGITDTTGCANCHAKTADPATPGKFKNYTAALYHLSGTPNLVFKNNNGKTGMLNADKTCSATYCHGSVSSPQWGLTVGVPLPCDTCHSASTASAYWSANTAHKLHWEDTALPTSYTMAAGNTSGSATIYRFACSSCHNPASGQATHASGPANANGVAQVFFGYTAKGRVGSYVYSTTQATSDNGFTWTAGDNCASTYCHSNGQGGSGLVAVTWNTSAHSGTCLQCHDTKQTGTTATGLSGKHNAHMNPTANTSLGLGNGFNCIDCHAKTVANNTTIVNKLKHVNKYIDYSGVKAGGSTRYNGATKQCSNIYCHSNGNPAATVYVNPPAWTSSSILGCNGCHGTSSLVGAPDYNNGGAGTTTANSHYAHTRNAADTTVCASCHVKTASLTTGGRFKDYTAIGYHLNGTANVKFNPAKASASASWDSSTGTCSNVACHGNVSVVWGSAGAGCLTCHAGPIGNRAAIGPQFSATSHHIQGQNVTGSHCYQCHWEANADGSINYNYHHSDVSGAAVELVVYGAGTRPVVYAPGTFVRYTANGSPARRRTEITKLNIVCLSCHSDQNNSTTPFADGRTPKQYSWDGSSVGARYVDSTTTAWGKYAGANVSPKSTVTKAFSGHGNAVNNKGGWDLTETWTDRKATANVVCFDCHNSHGSTATGILTSYSSATGSKKGGILKDTTAGRGGYSMTYRPAAGGAINSHNIYNAGAALCFDCHMTNSAGITPWGYNSTFGSTQLIMGYFDSIRFGNTTSGSSKRYPYKALKGSNQGGHFGVSSALSTPVMGSIGGLCTPCHDPHGVNPTAANRAYRVPMLKGTWLTSPYKEDVAPLKTNEQRGGGSGRRGGWGGWGGDWDGSSTSGSSNGYSYASTPSYNIDQNTFSTSWNFSDTTHRVTETVDQFGGLCISCHTKTSIAPGNNSTWKSVDRIHNSVKGWGTYGGNAGNKAHSYTCSKCHVAHNSELPRLMATNCLNYSHRGQVATGGPTPVKVDHNSGGRNGGGSGGFPGGGNGGDSDSHDSSYSWSGGRNDGSSGTYSFGGVTCHDNTNNSSYPSNQLWNLKTPWGNPGAAR